MAAPPPQNWIGVTVKMRLSGKRDAPASSSPVTPRSDRRVEGIPRRPSPAIRQDRSKPVWAFVGR
jgi:hypothetical protein